MVKNKNNQTIIVVLIAVVAIMFFMKPGDVPTNNNTGGGSSSGGTVDLCPVVSPTASFTAQRMFLAGTAITGQEGFVRVIKMNGGTPKDLGLISVNSGTLSTAPNGQYKLYYGLNGTTYYTHVESYTAPCQEAVDDKMAELCTVDTTPTITRYDEDGQTNNWSMGVDEEYTGYIKVKVSADECFGNPSAPIGNAICVEYTASEYTSIAFDDLTPITAPFVYASDIATGNASACFDMGKISDNGETERMPFTLKANGNPTQMITVSVIDVGFDLNADTLEEIWGFQDEDNNQISFRTTNLTIEVS